MNYTVDDVLIYLAMVAVAGAISVISHVLAMVLL